MASPLIEWACALCNSTDVDVVIVCRGCEAVAYCCVNHLNADTAKHHDACKLVESYRERVDEEEKHLETESIDLVTEGTTVRANVFEAVGQFGHIPEAKNYMAFRFGLAQAFLKIKIYEAVDKAFDLCWESHRLDRADIHGSRTLTAWLLLRMGRDQECYDFIKWNQTTGRKTTYGPGEPELPYLDIENSNVFESARVFIHPHCEFSHRIAIILLKIRLLQDVRNLHNSNAIIDRVPREIFDMIRRYLVSDTVAARRDITDKVDQTRNILKLEGQIPCMYGAVKAVNKYFWPGLLDPEPHLKVLHDNWGECEESEMQVQLQHAYDAWAETPGAIDIIRSIMAMDKEIASELGVVKERRPYPHTIDFTTPVLTMLKRFQKQPQWMYKEHVEHH